MRICLVLTLLLLLLGVGRAQDTATLDGEPAIRFLAGHGHLTNYCEGQLWITATRVRFDGVTVPSHSFDYKREQVKDVHAVSSFGFHYVKLEAGGHTYRMGIYPELEHALGDRFALAVEAFRDFPTAWSEVRAVETKRMPAPEIRLTPDGALEFPVLAGAQVLWFKGPKGVAVWCGPESGADAYGKIEGKYEAGTLRVSRDRVEFVTAQATQAVIGPVDTPRSNDKLRINSAVGGYARVVLNFRSAGRVSFVTGSAGPEGLSVYDAAPLVRALGPEFAQVVDEVRKAGAK